MKTQHPLIIALLKGWPKDSHPKRPITKHRCDECDETDKLLGGRSWDDVLHNFPDFCHDVFPLLNEDAKRYYLPAYIGSSILEGGVQSISLQAYFKSDEFNPDQFTKSQLRIIEDWVRHKLDPKTDLKIIQSILRKIS